VELMDDDDRQDWIDGAHSDVLVAVKAHANSHDPKSGECRLCDAWWLYASLVLRAGTPERAKRLAWLL
jgi:hypothetical protein